MGETASTLRGEGGEGWRDGVNFEGVCDDRSISKCKEIISSSSRDQCLP